LIQVSTGQNDRDDHWCRAPASGRPMPTGTTMEPASLLPHVNATLNAVGATLLISARVAIAQHRVDAHRCAMLAALAVSALFLVGYIAHHFASPITQFRGEGLVRPFYYALLISHVLLAAMAIPLILVTAVLGLRRRDLRHRHWARWTWPLWMYVSLSGVAVYLMLYQIYR
jgi:putative membrane protein